MSDFGFPLEYSELSTYYDALSQGDHSRTHEAIDNILQGHQVHSVIDFTCGTGKQLLWLIQRGYEVTGVDLSPQLLAIAREKAQNLGLRAHLIEGDIRKTYVGVFEAAISIFNAIGHLTKPDFLKALSNIRENLKSGALYIFDIFNLEAMSERAINDLAMDVQYSTDSVNIHHIQTSTLNGDLGQLTSFDTFTISEGRNPPRLFKEQFTLQIYSADELTQMLEETGFNVLQFYSLDGTAFSQSESTSILTIAQAT